MQEKRDEQIGSWEIANLLKIPNSLSITQIMDIGSLVRLRIKTKDGKSSTVQITKRLFNEIGFNIGSRAFMALKVSCVELI